MPPKRNQLHYRHLTAIERARAHGMLIAGMKSREVALFIGVHHSTIARIVDKENNNYASVPHGRQYKTTPRTDRTIAREARKGYIKRRQPLAQLQQTQAPQISKRTVQRRLKERNIQKHPATDRPLLKNSHKQARLEWAQRYKHYSAKDWCDTIWSDEVSVAQSDGKTTTWIFRTSV